jgi:hypothetical protein
LRVGNFHGKFGHIANPLGGIDRDRPAEGCLQPGWEVRAQGLSAAMATRPALNPVQIFQVRRFMTVL